MLQAADVAPESLTATAVEKTPREASRVTSPHCTAAPITEVP